VHTVISDVDKASTLKAKAQTLEAKASTFDAKAWTFEAKPWTFEAKAWTVEVKTIGPKVFTHIAIEEIKIRSTSDSQTG